MHNEEVMDKIFQILQQILEDVKKEEEQNGEW